MVATKNPQYQIRSTKQIRMTTIPINKTAVFCFLKIRIFNLSFDWAQDGELVEPFRISVFEFQIYQYP